MNKCGKKVCKNAAEIPAVRFPRETMNYFGNKNAAYQGFFISSSYNQLDVLKAIISSQMDQECIDDLISFLVVCYLEAPSKHPVKGFIMRHVMKARRSFQVTFSKCLANEIENMACSATADFLSDMMSVYKMSKCIDFNIGITALELVADVVVMFFKLTLRMSLREFSDPDASPSLKKDITNHCHETLRLFLLIIQRYQMHGCQEPNLMDDETRSTCKSILNHDEIPMDTKCLCGIVVVRALVLEIGEEDALQSVFGQMDNWMKDFLSNDIEVLVIYSALGTKPSLDWTALKIDDVPAVIRVLDHIVAIGERASSNASITLSVARAVYHLSKYLGTIDKIYMDSGSEYSGPTDSSPEETSPGVVGPIVTYSEDSSPKASGPSESVPKASGSKDSGAKDTGTKDSLPKDSSAQDTGTNDSVPKEDSVHQDSGPEESGPKDSVSRDGSPIYTGIIDNALAENLVAYVHTVIDHSMDSVRYLAGQTLNQIAKFYNQSKDYDKLNNILGNSNHPLKRSYFLIADNILGNMDDSPRILVVLIVKNCIKALFKQEVQSVASVCLESIISKCVNHSHYLSMILSLLLIRLEEKTEQGMVEAPVFEIYDRLVYKILLLGGSQRAIPILRKVKCSDDMSPISDSNLIAVLVIMRAFQKLPPTPNVRQASLAESQYSILQVAAVHPRDEYRILSLSVVIETKKTTKKFHQQDFSFIMLFLKYNINAQSPNFRQLTTSLMKKLIQRLSDSYNVIVRERCSYEECYANFVHTLRSFCIGCLMPGANVSRRGIALQVIFWLDSMNLPNTRIFSKEDVLLLLPCLEDSYENYKELALETLLNCPADLIKENATSVSLSLADLLQEASSVKPTECISAAYKLLLVEQKCMANFKDEENMLDLLISRLQAELEVAKKNIILAAANGPMYGLVYCMRKIFKSTRRPKTKLFIEELISTCMKVNIAVAPIVNNSSPEGHLPMDLDTLAPRADDKALFTLVGDSGVTLPDGRVITSQMVLLCGWRSVKEVSLLFGELSLYLTIEQHDLPWLLSVAQIKTIGNHFITLLSETKHRGAFEQAYIGFTQLATRLWSSNLPELHSLPPSWLTEVIAEITKVSNQLCPTRRSAGLPYIIQALVTTELQVNGNGQYFHMCMDWLLRNADQTNEEVNSTKWMFPSEQHDEESKVSSEPIEKSAEVLKTTVDYYTETMPGTSAKDVPLNIDKIETSLDEEYRDTYRIEGDGAQSAASTSEANEAENITNEVEIRTHCSNILRALYRNTSLGEAASSWVQDGLLVAIRGLDGKTWQERNSSTLLLNSLIVRVFGVQRSKDSEKLNMRNKMTAQVFFLRYPAMHDFMMDMLKYSEEKNREGVLCHSLFGILLILARLYQSSLEGTENNFKLSVFVSAVMRCGSSPVLQTRRLAAKAIASIVPTHLWHGQVMATLALLKEVYRNANHLHGLLLQLTLLFKNAPESVNQELEDELVEAVRMVFGVVFTQTEADALALSSRFIIRNEMLKMINQFSIRFTSIVIKEEDIIPFTDEHMEESNIQAPFFHTYMSNLFYYCTIIHLKEMENGTTDTYKFSSAHGGLNRALHTNTCDTLNAVPYEVLLVELNYILIALNKIYEDNMCEFQKHIYLLLQRSSLGKVVEDYFESHREVLDECLSNIIKNSIYFECQEKSIMILNSFRNTAKTVVESIMSYITTSVDDVAKQLIDIIEVSHEKLSCMCFETLLNLLATESMMLEKDTYLESLRLICRKSTSNNSDDTRDLIDSFLSVNFNRLFDMNVASYQDRDKFEHKALLWCTLISLLEDDTESIRQSAAVVVASITGHERPLLATAAGKALREHIACGVSMMDERMALMLLLALFDFNSAVSTQTNAGDNRVFDQCEQPNVYIEEIIWTKGFVKHILLAYQKRDTNDNLKKYAKSLIEHPDYRVAMITLCGKNLDLYKKLLSKKPINKKGNEYWNPKVEYLFRKLI